MLARTTHLVDAQVGCAKPSHCLHEAAWCSKNTRNLLVCNGDKSQRIKGDYADEIISMDLRPTDFVPRQHRLFIAFVCR
jgi:hypothetical protein